jgi:hypothetical protein
VLPIKQTLPLFDFIKKRCEERRQGSEEKDERVEERGDR